MLSGVPIAIGSISGSALKKLSAPISTSFFHSSPPVALSVLLNKKCSIVISASVRVRNKIRRPDACHQIASAYFPKEVLCLIQSPRNDEDSDERRMSQSHGVFVIARPAHKAGHM